MNIFITNQCPEIAANNLQFYSRLHDKMILESAQLLFNTAIRLGFPTPYKAFNPNHECALWVLQNSANLCWLYDHILQLSLNYIERKGKVHKSSQIVINWMDNNFQLLKSKYTKHDKLTLPCLAFSDGNEDLEKQYGHYVPNPRNKKKPYAVANTVENACVAYQEYLRRKPYSQDKVLQFA